MWIGAIYMVLTRTLQAFLLDGCQHLFVLFLLAVARSTVLCTVKCLVHFYCVVFFSKLLACFRVSYPEACTVTYPNQEFSSVIDGIV